MNLLHERAQSLPPIVSVADDEVKKSRIRKTRPFLVEPGRLPTPQSETSSESLSSTTSYPTASNNAKCSLESLDALELLTIRYEARFIRMCAVRMIESMVI